MKIRKCERCKYFTWEDEIPECYAGVDKVKDFDDFIPKYLYRLKLFFCKYFDKSTLRRLKE